MSAARRKRVQVGWYCNHETEPYGARTHITRNLKRGKWVVVAAPNTVQSLTALYDDPKKRPPCERATPIYIYVSPEVTP